MARVRPLYSYPREFWDIVQGAGTGSREFTIVCETITKALSMQGKFYAFRQAMAKEALTSTIEQENLKLALNTICWVDKKSWTAAGGGEVTLKFCNKNQHPDSVMLRGAVVREVSLPKEQEEEAMAILHRVMKDVKPEVDPTGGKYG